MKHLIGKTVWLRGTGNNEPRNGEHKIISAVVVGVAKVNAELLLDGYSSTKKMRMASGNSNAVAYLDAGHNYGWEVYEAEQDLLDQIRTERLAQKISKHFRFQAAIVKLGLDKVQKIADILGESDAG